MPRIVRRSASRRPPILPASACAGSCGSTGDLTVSIAFGRHDPSRLSCTSRPGTPTARPWRSSSTCTAPVRQRPPRRGSAAWIPLGRRRWIHRRVPAGRRSRPVRDSTGTCPVSRSSAAAASAAERPGRRRVSCRRPSGPLEAGLCVDPTRVFATGFSGGARMTSQLGCDLPATVAAIAPVSGLRLPVAVHGHACGSGHLVSRNRRSDRPVQRQRAGVLDVQRARGRAAMGRDTTLRRRTDGDHPVSERDVDRVLADALMAATVELYTITGEGHEWPGGPILPGRHQRARPAINRRRCRQHHVAVLRGAPLPVS